MSYLDAARIFVGTGTFLFLGATMVGLGLHLGLRLGAKWFGAIQITKVEHQYRYSSRASRESE